MKALFLGHKGFTLIELSIVLVIIGLIVGGILAGRDLIRAAELKSIITQESAIITAINTFRGKYNCIPGDCDHATEFFGSLSVCPNGGYDPINGHWNEAHEPTCNGNGDGLIALNYAQLGPGPSSDDEWESLHVWQHLSFAGLIPGLYPGVGVNAGKDIALGINAPVSKLANSGFDIAVGGYAPGDFYAGDYGNSVFFGLPLNDRAYGASLTNQDAFQIDSKLDDGLPGTGTVRTHIPYYYTPDCGTTTDPLTSVYDKTKTVTACSLVFPHAF